MYRRYTSKFFLFIILFFVSIAFLIFSFGYFITYQVTATKKSFVTFTVSQGESVHTLSTQLQDTQIIKSAWIFRQIIFWSGVDTNIRAGTFLVRAPITLARVIDALKQPGITAEKTITILPGWDLNDIASYMQRQGIGTKHSFFALVGKPATDPTTSSLSFLSVIHILKNKPTTISYEGYLRPDTYQIYAHASLESVVKKLIQARDKNFTPQMYKDMKGKHLTVNALLTMASIIDKEAKTSDDMAKVADIFWRRLQVGMPFQSDATVLYAVGKKGSVFTSDAERATQNAWNTYLYIGFPPGPIDNPSDAAIHAALYPKKNKYWYFLADKYGIIHYAKTLVEHTVQVQKYLR